MHRVLQLMAEFRKALVIGAVFGGCLGAVSVALAVNAASGSWGYTPSIDGHVYKGRSTINTDEPGSPSDWAAASIYPTDGSTIPSGWMAADARKYKDGSLCEESGYEYNQSPATGMIVYANSVACGSGTYYAYGLMAAWNGSGYQAYYQPQSPNLNG